GLLQEVLRDVLVTAVEACGPQEGALSGSHELDELLVPWWLIHGSPTRSVCREVALVGKLPLSLPSLRSCRPDPPACAARRSSRITFASAREPLLRPRDGIGHCSRGP